MKFGLAPLTFEKRERSSVVKAGPNLLVDYTDCSRGRAYSDLRILGLEAALSMNEPRNERIFAGVPVTREVTLVGERISSSAFGTMVLPWVGDSAGMAEVDCETRESFGCEIGLAPS